MANKQPISRVIAPEVVPQVKAVRDEIALTKEEFLNFANAIQSNSAAIQQATNFIQLSKGVDAATASLEGMRVSSANLTQQSILEARLLKELEQARLAEAKANEASEKAKAQLVKTESEVIKQIALEQKYAAELTKEIERLNKERGKSEALLNKANNEYEQLKKQYNETANEAKRLAAAYGVESAAAVDAANKANLLHGQLTKIENSVGQYQRNVGNYTQATFALTQVLREAPSFAYSFQTGLLAISNNLPILNDEFIKLKTATGSAGAAFGVLARSVFSMGNVFTLAFAAITIFLPAITRLFTATKELTAEQKEQKKAMDEMTSSIGKQTTLLNTLYNTATDVALSTKQRLTAVDELQKKFPEYFANIERETILNGKAKDSYDALAKSIVNNAVEKSFTDKIEKLAEKKAKYEVELQKSQQPNTFFMGDIDEIKANIKLYDDLINEQLRLMKERKERFAGAIVFGDDKQVRNIKAIKDELTEVNKDLELATIHSQKYNDLIEKRNKLNKELEAAEAKPKRDKKERTPQDNLEALARSVNKDFHFGETQAEHEAALKKLLESDKKYVQDRFADLKQLEDYEREQADKEKKILIQKLKDGKITVSQYHEEIKKIDDNTNKAILAHQIEQVRKWIYSSNLEYDAKKLLYDKLNELSKQFSAAEVKAGEDAALTKEEREKKVKEQAIESAKGMYASLEQIRRNALDQEGIELQIRRQNLQRETQDKINAVNATIGNQANKQQQLNNITAQSHAQSNFIAAQEKDLSIRKAKGDKQAAEAGIVENTAIGVTSMLPYLKPPTTAFAIGMIALITALGAAQFAAAASAPIPTYATGGKHPQDGPAIFGEAGPEIATLPSGKSIYADKATKIIAPAGTEFKPLKGQLREYMESGINPNHMHEAMAINMQMEFGKALKGVEDKLDNMVLALQSKQPIIFNGISKRDAQERKMRSGH